MSCRQSDQSDHTRRGLSAAHTHAELADAALRGSDTLTGLEELVRFIDLPRGLGEVG